MTERHDIASRSDIARMVDAFYESVRADAILGPIFDDVAHTDWAAHLPKMYDFWETVLFGTATGFRGNPLAVHLALSTRVPLGEREFGRWIQLFHHTIDALFAGAVAEDAKARAVRIAGVMQHHITMRAVLSPAS
jgi:hemoglobin